MTEPTADDPAHDAGTTGPTGVSETAPPVGTAAAASATPPRSTRGGLAGALAVYSLMRFALLVAIAALLAFFVPLVFALIIAVILQLPLAWLLFGRQRAKVNALLAEANAGKREERARLRAQLYDDGRQTG